MKEPNLVSECINEMINSCNIPVTAKTRIGYDNIEDFDRVTVAQALDKAREDLRNASEEERKGFAQQVTIGEAKLAAIDIPAYD
mgnify:CR=1 FL=1